MSRRSWSEVEIGAEVDVEVVVEVWPDVRAWDRVVPRAGFGDVGGEIMWRDGRVEPSVFALVGVERAVGFLVDGVASGELGFDGQQSGGLGFVLVEPRLALGVGVVLGVQGFVEAESVVFDGPAVTLEGTAVGGPLAAFVPGDLVACLLGSGFALDGVVEQLSGAGDLAGAVALLERVLALEVELGAQPAALLFQGVAVCIGHRSNENAGRGSPRSFVRSQTNGGFGNWTIDRGRYYAAPPCPGMHV